MTADMTARGTTEMPVMIDMISNSNFIDMHYHVSPDLFDRRRAIKNAGEKYKELKGAVCLKSHLCSTVEAGILAQEYGLPVIGSLVMNNICGGINYKTILKYLSINKQSQFRLIVYFPTLTGRSHATRVGNTYKEAYLEAIAGDGETVSAGTKLKDCVLDVLKLACDYPIVLATGHASKEEVFLLAEECDKLGVDRLLLTHPGHPIAGLTYEELFELSQYGFLWFEQTALTYLLGYMDNSYFGNVLNYLPNVIYSSDLGQKSQIDIQSWLIQSKKWFEMFKVSPDRAQAICKDYPLKILRKEL